MHETEMNASCDFEAFLGEGVVRASDPFGSRGRKDVGASDGILGSASNSAGESGVSETFAGIGAFEGESAQEEARDGEPTEESLTERIEHEALVAVFDDVRRQSSDGKLVEPSRWAEISLVPGHMTEEEFEMFVFEHLEEFAATQNERPEEEAPVVRTAVSTVGVSRFKAPKPADLEGAQAFGESPRGEGSRGEGSRDEGSQHESFRSEDSWNENSRNEGTLGTSIDEETAQAMAEGRIPAVAETVTPYGENPDDGDAPFEPFEMTVGGKRGMVELVEGEPTFVPYAPGEAPREEIDCKNIAVLVGAHSYYLYAKDRMSDNFAHWAFLAKEDSDVVTLVECAREESRTYPRPMPASSLKNDPFFFDDGRIVSAWRAVEESGEFPDMETVFASNGDQYFFSTEHISRSYAESLAEWASVERYMNV